MLSLIVGTFLLVSSCSSSELELDVSFGRDAFEYADTTLEFYWARSEGVRNVLRRATQMATIQWTPINSVPWNRGEFLPGSTVVGIPYSSTKQVNKYVGLDVSFHTFMTAVHNPRSVLYTENLGKNPYNGVNCATYYGTVCSTCVDYALGIDIPFPTKTFPENPDFEEITLRDLKQLEPGDVMVRPEQHVFMIYRVAKSVGGTPITITYMEAGSKICCLESVSAKAFSQKIKEEGLLVYRYKKIDEVMDYEPSEYVPVGDEMAVSVQYNEALCPNRGDRAVYRIDEPVIINSFDSTFSDLVVEGNGFFTSVPREDDVVFDNLEPGNYVAYLTEEDRRSDSVEFLVANPQINIRKGDRLHIDFSCDQGEARYCVLCDKVGSFKVIHVLTEDEVRNQSFELDYPEMDNFFCKVVFKTPFGTVINNPIPVSR
jgi:hypothetical protein